MQFEKLFERAYLQKLSNPAMSDTAALLSVIEKEALHTPGQMAEITQALHPAQLSYPQELQTMHKKYLEELHELQSVIGKVAEKNNLTPYKVEDILLSGKYRDYRKILDGDHSTLFDATTFSQSAATLKKMRTEIQTMQQRCKQFGFNDTLAALTNPHRYNAIFDIMEAVGVDMPTAIEYFRRSKGSTPYVLEHMKNRNISFYEALHEWQTEPRILGEKTIGIGLAGLGLAAGITAENIYNNQEKNSNFLPKTDATTKVNPQLPLTEKTAAPKVIQPSISPEPTPELSQPTNKLEKESMLTRLKNLTYNYTPTRLTQGILYAKWLLSPTTLGNGLSQSWALLSEKMRKFFENRKN